MADVIGVVGPWLGGDAKIAAEEGCGKLGHQFFHRAVACSDGLSFEGDGLLATFVLNPHAAEILVVAGFVASEDDKAGFYLFLVGDEFHFPCPTVHNLCRVDA